MKPETDAFFISERRRPLSRKTAWLAIRTYGERAGLPVEAHPHMLRHACGFALGRPGRRHAIDSGLSGAPEYSAYRHVHGDQPGTV